MKNLPKDKRNKEIFNRYKKGLTYTQIAKKYNISSTRARQIVLREEYEINSENRSGVK